MKVGSWRTGSATNTEDKGAIKTVTIEIDKQSMWWRANQQDRRTFENSMEHLLAWLEQKGFGWKYIEHPDPAMPSELLIYRKPPFLDDGQ